MNADDVRRRLFGNAPPSARARAVMPSVHVDHHESLSKRFYVIGRVNNQRVEVDDNNGRCWSYCRLCRRDECIHIEALILSVEEPPSEQSADLPNDVESTRVLDALDRLESGGAGADIQPSPLAFVMEWRVDHFKILMARIENGKLLRFIPYNAHTALAAAQSLEEDVLVRAILQRNSEDYRYAGNGKVDDRTEHRLFERALLLGRLYINDRPIQRSTEVVHATIRWEMTANQRQRPVIELADSGLVLIRGQALWAFDEAALTSAPVQIAHGRVSPADRVAESGS